MVEELAVAGCTDFQLIEPGWAACTSPRGSRLTLSWDESRGTLTLVRYLTRRDGSSLVGRFRMLQAAADTAATL
jgi:hypothetical protein